MARQAPRWAWAVLAPLMVLPFGPYAVLGPTGTDAALAAKGEALILDKGCLQCHQIDGVGEAVACDLDRIGRRRHKAWLRAWLKDPQALRPGTAMPDPGLSHAEAVALAEFLARRQ